MKKFFTIVTIACILITQNANAKVWRVNNNTGVQADFTTVTAAVNAAAAGDTIYIESSVTQYDGATISKQLTIIGTGYYLTDTANHETQWNTDPSTVGHFNFAAGSAHSVVSGLYMNSYEYLNDSAVTMERCYVNGQIVFGNGSNINCDHDTVRQCVINSSIVSQPSGGTFSAIGEMVYNNIIDGGISFTNSNGYLADISTYFINNDFLYPSAYTCENCVFQNNIFYGPVFGSYGTSNYFANNILSNSSASSSVPTSNSNQFGVDMKNVFVAATSTPYSTFTSPAVGMSHDGQYMLADGSPAIGAGDINGVTVDCGTFGGPAPYVLSGMPNIPSIYSLTVPAQINDGTATINISLSSAAH